MQIEELKTTLITLIEKQLPTFIWGSPGIGKSSIVKEIAKESEVEFLDLRLSLLDPTDLKGIPFFDSNSNQAVWAAPEFLPQERKSLGILFLDEINTAPPSVQAAAYQLVLDRRVGDYTLPDGWAIVAAGNKESDRGVVYRMPSPLANRFVHLELEVSFENWKKWAYAQGIEPSIIAFLHYEPSWLFTFNPQEQQKAFATPRSWEYVDKIVKSDLQASTLLETLSGTIGKEAAIAYLAFKKVMQKLPDIDAILRGESVAFEKENELLFALIAGIVSKTQSSQEIESVIRFSFLLPPEFSVMLIKDLQQNGKEIEESEAFLDWVEKYSNLLE